MAKIPSRKFSTIKKKIASRPFPKSKVKIPSKPFGKGTAKIASRQFSKPVAVNKKQAPQPLLDRPTNEKARQDRLATLTSKLKLWNPANSPELG